MDAPIVAYRFPEHLTTEIVCADPECLAFYADLMATVAIPMTQANVEEEQVDREGHTIWCASCTEPLDLFTRASA
jgi:hypothetical protein